MSDEGIRCGILGGSGLYSLAGMSDVDEVEVETPFGPPSDKLLVGSLEGRRVAFLARHGRGHRLLPTEINFRANIFAMKSLGIERIVSASAVGSLRESIRPRDAVLVDQFIDRTNRRVSTFFGSGIVAHVSLADPVCPQLREILRDAREEGEPTLHDGGTYVCIEGPAFSTRAESELFRSWDADVIGMTNLQEARLAREAEICYASLALVTDFDCWHEEEDDVSVGAVMKNLTANGLFAAKILRRAVRSIPERRQGCSCEDALRGAIITRPEEIDDATRRKLAPIVGRHLD